MLSPRASTAMPTRLYFGVHRLLTIIAFSVMGRAPRSVVVAPRDLPFEQRLDDRRSSGRKLGPPKASTLRSWLDKNATPRLQATPPE